MSTAPSFKREAQVQLPAVDPTVVAHERLLLNQFTEALSEVQKRLGTPQERAGDCQRARDLGHAIRNKLHVLRLWGNLGLLPKSNRTKSPQLQQV